MKFCRFDDERLGLIDGNKVRDVTAALDVLPRCSYPLPQHDIFIANLEAVTTRARAVAKDVRALPLESVTLLSPVANPGKIIAAPVNYQKHLDRGARQPAAARQQSRHTRSRSRRRAVSEGDELARRARARASSSGVPKRRTDHEVELAVVIGRTASRVKRDEALSLRRRVLDRSRYHDPRQRGPQLPQVAGYATACSGPGSSPPTRSPIPASSICRSPSTTSCVSNRTRNT